MFNNKIHAIMKTIRSFKSPEVTINVEEVNGKYYVTRKVSNTRKTTVDDYDTRNEALFAFLRSVSMWII